MSKKRYAQVGLGGRGTWFNNALLENFTDEVDLVAICDANPGRLKLAAEKMAKLGIHPKCYPAEKFEEMITENNVQRVMVTTGPDVTHDDYIIRAMKLGCDVMSEKPMTTDETRCRAILKTIAETGRDLQVTFNYRYSPPRSQVRKMLADGVIGDILSVDFSWLLDTAHGADYFRRWHRQRKNSGSLLVHKSTHHFDLVNWWLQDVPETVFCSGSRKFYTPAEADSRGLTHRGQRCLDCPESGKCPLFLDLAGGEQLKALYLDNEQHDGYFRDRCVFSDEINIWDTMAANVIYRRGTILNYMLHTYSPCEGYQIAFNGTRGRLEHACCETTYINGDGTVPGQLKDEKTTITLIPEFNESQEIEVETGEGGHGGGDPLLTRDVFGNPQDDPLKRRAGEVDGAYSILVGIAAAKSIDENRPINISDLLGDTPIGK